MSKLIESPLYTSIADRHAPLRFDEETVYFAGDALEREDRTSWWKASCKQNDMLVPALVTSVGRTTAEIDLGGVNVQVQLRGTRDFNRLLERVDGRDVCIDITGLPLSVWAPLLRSVLASGLNTRAIYVEPGQYRFSADPIEGGIFDLSERVEGVAPIPGFACLSRLDEDSSVFVPILGFEGPRFAHVLENVQPADDQIWPIIGVPGALLEFPFFVYLGNKRQLVETHAWSKVRHVRANCPFGLFAALENLAQEWDGCLLRIALLGPKPHILGALLYYLSCPEEVELIYDHPITRDRRSEGIGRICCYDLSSWAKSVNLKSIANLQSGAL